MLLILATVSLSAVFSEKGIFNRAEKAGNRYNEAKAREVLETVLLADGQYEKNTNPKYNQEDFLNELIKKEIEGVEIKGDVAIIDGWAFLLDRSVPKIGDPLGRADSLIFPTVKVSNPKLATDYRTASFTVTAIEATNGINKIEIWLNGEKIKNLDKTYNNVKEEIEQEFTVSKNGVYTVKVYGKLMASATVEVTGIVPAVEFTPNGNTDWKKEHQTKITVKTNETITSMKYLWTTSGTNPPEISDFNNAEPCTNNSIIAGGNDTMTGTYHLWVLLTTQTGEIQKTNICGSKGFNFDNEGPTITLESIPVSETSFTLTATASDDKSGIAKYEFYVDGEKKEPTTVENGKATYTWNGTEMTKKNCYVIVTDNVENTKQKDIEARTKLHMWEKWNCSETYKYKTRITENTTYQWISSQGDCSYFSSASEAEYSWILKGRGIANPYTSPTSFVGKYVQGQGPSSKGEEGSSCNPMAYVKSYEKGHSTMYRYDWVNFVCDLYDRIRETIYVKGTNKLDYVTDIDFEKYINDKRNSDGYWYIYIGIQ